MTFTTPMTGGEEVIIYTDIAVARDVQYQQSGDLPHDVLDRDFAKLIRIAQQHERDIGKGFVSRRMNWLRRWYCQRLLTAQRNSCASHRPGQVEAAELSHVGHDAFTGGNRRVSLAADGRRAGQ